MAEYRGSVVTRQWMIARYKIELVANLGLAWGQARLQWYANKNQTYY